MKILLDVRSMALLHHGVSRVASEVSSRLPELCPEWEWIFLNYDSNPEMAEKEERRGNVINIWGDSGLHNYASDQIMYSKLLKKYTPDLIYSFWYHLPEFYEGFKILMVHDRLQEMGYPEFNEDYILKERYWMNRSIASADAIVVNSLSTMRDVVRFNKIAPDNIFLTYLAAGNEFFKKDLTRFCALKEKYSLPEKYIFLSAHSDVSYKNSEIVFRSVKKLRAQGVSVPIIVSTGGEKTVRTDEWMRLPYLNLDDLASVVAGAEFVIYPSQGEGFGLPPLEAMAAGTPVITSNADSLPEVCGEAVIYFDPKSMEELSASIILLLNNKNFCDYLSKKGMERAKLFSWDKCAVATLDAIKTVIAKEKIDDRLIWPVNWDDVNVAFNLPPINYKIIPENILYPVSMLLKKNNKSAAMSILFKALNFFPESPDILRELGKIYKSDGEFVKASEYFRKLLAVAEKTSAFQHLRSGYYHLGECEFNLKNYETSADLFGKCLKYCPDHKTAPVFLQKIRDILE